MAVGDCDSQPVRNPSGPGWWWGAYMHFDHHSPEWGRLWDVLHEGAPNDPVRGVLALTYILG